ncbi:MAG: aminopeptidase P family protein [Defluviitaleaceae bacterium]|nr:aminopeptidase P family protein [Defluviitaleaceae bacterium]
MSVKYAIEKEKIKQLEGLLHERDCDLLVFSREGSDKMLPFLIGEDAVHMAAAFFTSKKDGHVMLTSKSDEKKYHESGIFNSVETYDKSIAEKLPALLDNLAPRKLALNISTRDAIADGMTYGLYLTLADIVGKERLDALEISSEEIIRELRSVKTMSEIAAIRQSVLITCDIYDEVFTRIRCGMTEKEIADIFVDCMKKRGVTNGIGEPFSYPIVCIVRAGLAHRGPGDTKTIPGDILIMDFSVRYSGYVSDIARTAYFLKPGETKPPHDVRRAFDAAYNAITASIAACVEGARGFEIDAAGRKVIEDAGYPTVRHSVGHPLGRECHDAGTAISTFKGDENGPYNRKVKLNEIYAIEPTVIQDDGLPCMLVEENILITPSGPEILSRRQDALVLL